MQRKKKVCRHCKQECYWFGDKLCLQCYKILNPVTLKKSPIKKSDKPINKISTTEKARKKKYLLLREEFLKKEPFCQVEGCKHKSTEIHHMEGRSGDALFRNFLAVCSDHHKEIELNPVWAKEEGYSISRLKK